MRNGKIAKLPSNIRDELNLRLDDGEDGAKLLDWLNGLPEVQETLKESFGGAPISKQNLCEWRQGGFREWQIQQELISHASQLSQNGSDMDEVVDRPLLAGDLVAVVAARYAALLNTWDGEAKPEFEGKLRLMHGLAHDTALIQRAIERAGRQKTEFHQQLENERRREIAEAKKKVLAPIWAKLRSNNLAGLFGGGESGEKIAEFITAVQNDLPLPKIDLPSRTDAQDKNPGQTQSNPVKPEVAV